MLRTLSSIAKPLFETCECGLKHGTKAHTKGSERCCTLTREIGDCITDDAVNDECNKVPAANATKGRLALTVERDRGSLSNMVACKRIGEALWPVT